LTEKKQQIIDVALKCFADKGYQSTSIQEIADALGMAKGSLYFYFKSKEDLLVSICKHHFDLMLKDFRSIMENSGLAPRDKLIRQITLNYSHFVEHSDFIKLLMTERFEFNEEIHQSIFVLRAYSLVENQKCILELYGEEAGPYSFDAATIFSAMTTGYMGYVVKEQMTLDAQKVARFMVDRLDDVVYGMISKKVEPIMKEDEIQKFMSENPTCGFKINSGVVDDIRAIRELVDSLGLKPVKQEELESALQVLETEFDKPDPGKVVVKGMLALLKGYKAGAMKKHIANIESYLK
jgi:AcrR family transcriptional regulator